MAQQTAVEWLVKEISEVLGPIKTEPMQDLLLSDAIQQANKMFEEQIKDGWDNAAINASYSHNPKSFEQYYKETYGK